MYLDDFIGNKQTIESLKHSLNTSKFMHSVLLCGEAGTGVNYLARLLAADYLYPLACADSEGAAAEHESEQSKKAAQSGANSVLANECPEYIVVEGTGASGDIPVDVIRSVRKDIFGTALSANGRVVHIKKAQNLNNFSANALLKVLEEPPKGVLFIMTAPSQSAVLATLRSRAGVYTVGAVSEGECAEYLQKTYKNISDIKAKSESLSRIFAGKIGLCKYCIEDKDAQIILTDANVIKTAFYEKNNYKAMCAVSKYEKDKNSARVMLDILAQLCAADLRDGGASYKNAENAALGTGAPQSYTGQKAINEVQTAAASIIKRCGEAKRLLNKNVNTKTALVCFCV